MSRRILADRKILLISPERWDHIFVSKHHYAIHLGELGNQVFFVEPPGSVASVKHTEFRNVAVVNYSRFPSGLRFFPPALQRDLMRRKFEQIQDLCKTEFDVVWSFDNSVFFDFNALPAKVIKICHIVDLNQNFQTSKAARTAAACFCTTDAIKQRLIRFNKNVFKINHGFNVHAPKGIIRLPGNSRIKIVYAGNLSMPYIDWILISELVQQNPDVDFIFVGPNKEKDYADQGQSKAKIGVLKQANAYFVGQVNSNELIEFYCAADILLVAYQEKFHKDQANPHKFMEYLGSGKVVVATHTIEYADLKKDGLIAMSSANDELPELLKGVLANLSNWNSVDNQSARKRFALDNTYAKQIAKIENYLNSINVAAK